MQKREIPEVNLSPIAHLSSLASALSLSESELIQLSGNIESYYKPGPIKIKKDGSPRQTHDAYPELKKVHERIKNRFLLKVDYPDYLTGSISDSKSPRSSRSNAGLHCGKAVVLSEDIENFFPCTTFEMVRDVWLRLFHFSPQVSEVLARLTTCRGELLQGWITSSYLANLALWHVEPEVVRCLRKKGYSYSRYVDDIVVSSRRVLGKTELNFIVSKIYGMLLKAGYRPKRKKHQIMRPNKPMIVTGLGVKGTAPLIPQKERAAVRSAVFQLETRHPQESNQVGYAKEWRSVVGRAARVKSFHAEEGRKLQDRLSDIRPTPQVLKKISRSR